MFFFFFFRFKQVKISEAYEKDHAWNPIIKQFLHIRFCWKVWLSSAKQKLSRTPAQVLRDRFIFYSFTISFFSPLGTKSPNAPPSLLQYSMTPNYMSLVVEQRSGAKAEKSGNWSRFSEFVKLLTFVKLHSSSQLLHRLQCLWTLNISISTTQI